MYQCSIIRLYGGKASWLKWAWRQCRVTAVAVSSFSPRPLFVRLLRPPARRCTARRPCSLFYSVSGIPINFPIALLHAFRSSSLPPPFRRFGTPHSSSGAGLPRLTALSSHFQIDSIHSELKMNWKGITTKVSKYLTQPSANALCLHSPIHLRLVRNSNGSFV